jgi:hypothetical protein
VKRWLARLGWMVLGAVLLAAFVITKTLLFGDQGHMFPDASTLQIDATLTTLKKANCSYKVSVYVPKDCRAVLDEAVKQSSSKTGSN